MSSRRPPKSDVDTGLDRLGAIFWRLARAAVENRMDAEDAPEQQKPLNRVAPTRQAKIPAQADLPAHTPSASDTANHQEG